MKRDIEIKILYIKDRPVQSGHLMLITNFSWNSSQIDDIVEYFGLTDNIIYYFSVFRVFGG